MNRLEDVETAAIGFSSGQTRRNFLHLVNAAVIWALSNNGLRQSPSVAQPCVIEYPPRSLADCPNRRHHPGHTPTSNGCGAEGSIAPIPDGFGEADFLPACNAHDICYGTCNSVKATCDTNFRAALHQACIDAYPPGLRRSACITVADGYANAVTKYGQSAYDAAQLQDCECCRPPAQLYCACNKTCYTDIQTCLLECHVTLGCSTGICVPASQTICPP